MEFSIKFATQFMKKKLKEIKTLTMMSNLLKPVLLDSVRVSTCQMTEWVKAQFASYTVICIPFATTKSTEIELILNTSVKKRRTNLLVLQMVGPRHGVSDANS